MQVDIAIAVRTLNIPQVSHSAKVHCMVLLPVNHKCTGTVLMQAPPRQDVPTFWLNSHPAILTSLPHSTLSWEIIVKIKKCPNHELKPYSTARYINLGSIDECFEKLQSKYLTTEDTLKTLKNVTINKWMCWKLFV